MEINFITNIEMFKGCTIVNGTLQIRLNEDNPTIMNELKRGLGDIEEIIGYLKIYRSSSITSLDFLRSLNVIHGQNEKEYGKYSLIVYENPNLQTLWNWKAKTELRILSGSLYFHYNAKLCPSEIEILKNRTIYNNTDDFITADNGFYFCNIQPISTKYEVLNHENVTLYWKPFEKQANQQILGDFCCFNFFKCSDVSA